MLSEKAKGKQRAVEVEDLIPSKELCIRFTEGIPDLTLQVGEQDAVRDIKIKIREAKPQLKDRRLRLIHSGQLLTDTTLLYSRLTTQEDRQRRITPHGEETESSPQAPISHAWLHCSIGPQLKEGEEDESKVQTAQLKPLRGFDRLAAAGFSEQDIASIRLQFHSQSASDYLDQDFEDGEDFDEHARALEEQWIDSMDNAGSASLSLSNSYPTSTFLNGVVMGFFFPLLPWFFFRAPKLAAFWEEESDHEVTGNVMFSKRTQMGLVVGFVMNLIFGIWTYLLTT